VNKDFDNNIPDFTRRKKVLKIILSLLVISLIILAIQLFYIDDLSYLQGNLTFYLVIYIYYVNSRYVCYYKKNKRKRKS